MSKIAKYLNQYIVGAVYDASSILDDYSTDRSILKVRPKVVALPKTTKDVRKLVRFSNQLSAKGLKLPVTVRGTGLDKTGASIGSGLVVSMEEMNKIQEIDPRQRLVRVQAGVTIGQLNSALALHGLTIPTKGHPDQTIGGIIANGNYRELTKYVAQAEIVLSTGDLIQTERLSSRRLSKKKGLVGFEGELFRGIDKIIADKADAFADTKDTAGYHAIGDVLLKNGSFDLLPLFFGSQGTLGIVTEVILSCDLAPEPTQYFIASYGNINAALEFVENVKALEPQDINIFDVNLFREVTDFGKKLRVLNKLPKNGIVVAVTLSDISMRQRRKKLKKIIKLPQTPVHFAASSEENYDQYVELASIISIYLNDLPRTSRAPIVDGAYVPTKELKKYFTGVTKLEEKYQTSLPIFGSILSEKYSIRPEIDLASVTGRQFVIAFLRDYAEVLDSCEGNIAADSAEGRLKAIVTNSRIDPSLVKTYNEIKTAFDPNGILNPGLKQDASLRSVVRQLRTSYNPGIVTE